VARFVITFCILALLPPLTMSITRSASAQPSLPVPNAVPPALQGPSGPPQVYPNRRGWPAPAEAYQTTQWPPDRVAQRPSDSGFQPPVQPPIRSAPAFIVFAPAETVAWVGDQQIFRGDLIGEANLILAPVLEKLPDEEIEGNREEIEAQREQIVQKLLPGVIDRKLMYLEFIRDAPQDKLDEILKNIQAKVAVALEESIFAMLEKLQKTEPEDYQELARQDNQLFRLALAMKEHNMTSLGQLERYLRSYGSSLEKQRQSFAERSLGQQKMRESIKIQPEVTHQEMLEYYRNEVQEFKVPAKARWQQLTIRFDRVRSDEVAGEAIAEMGNQIAIGGRAFWAVAKEKSHDPQAEQGGVHDWTKWGDLEVSREINKAVFSLPIGELSEIIIDGEGVHILKVLDRQAAHVTPFRDAQVDIRNRIQSRKRNEALAEYVARIHQQTPVRTIYDEPEKQGLAEPLRGRNEGRR